MAEIFERIDELRKKHSKDAKVLHQIECAESCYLKGHSGTARAMVQILEKIEVKDEDINCG